MSAFKSVAAATLAAALLSACVSEEGAADRRGNLIAQIFPDPLDRQGIFLAFPLESGGGLGSLEIIWFPDQVTEGEVVARVQGACARTPTPGYTGQVGISKDLGTTSIDTTTGPRTARQVFFKCLSA
jgi:Flp pilus assembly protein TadG